ncbi:MAG: F0F1 ATP synthase subunit gamma [Planctomycetaceae bacterium]
MKTLETLKRQIHTADDLATVVRTMKALAAVNIRQYEAAADSLGKYQETIEQAVRMLVWNSRGLAAERKPSRASRIGLIAFGSDQGMCGGFNESLGQFVVDSFDKLRSEGSDVRLVVLGRRLADRLLETGLVFDNLFDLPGAVSGMTAMLQDLLPWIDRWRTEHHLASLMVCHHRRLTRTNYGPVDRTLLPVAPQHFVESPSRRWTGQSLPLVTMPPEQLWRAIVRQYLFVSLFQACAESQASENAARITAMQSAETHIHDRLGELQLDYQHMRQTSITEELLEVITGFEALTTPHPQRRNRPETVP